MFGASSELASVMEFGFFHAHLAEADLGMFSMFGRTGAPTKKGPPQEDRQIFAT